ncbi:hypothetical protein D3C81_1999720 [compost metagenome]
MLDDDAKIVTIHVESQQVTEVSQGFELSDSIPCGRAGKPARPRHVVVVHPHHVHNPLAADQLVHHQLLPSTNGDRLRNLKPTELEITDD